MLVHRYAKKRRETEIDCLKIFRVDFLELFLSLLVVEMTILGRIHIEIQLLHMIRDDNVYHLVLVEVKVIDISNLPILQQT